MYIGVLLAALIVATLALVVGSGPVSGDRTPIRVVIRQGSSARAVTNTLHKSGLIRSQVVQAPDGRLRIALNGTQSQRTLSGRFLAEFFGAGVQHLAFASRDIFATAARLKAAGVALLEIPDNYYDDLEARFGLEPAFLDRLREQGLLYDRDESGAFLQLYTLPFAGRFFFEIVERRGAYGGFGAANAAVRLAMQSRSVETLR